MKKRILFVEDDPVLLQMYGLMLSDEREHWEVSTASNGEQALELMQGAPYDVVVSDWIMPGMNGAELMAEVRKRYPRSARIILSILSDQQKVAHQLGATHQFIAKPFDVKVLKAALTRLSGLDAYLKNEKLQALISRLGTLPSFPPLYHELMQELGSAEPSVEKVVAIISKDPGMTAKILQIVNSASIGLPRRIGSPFEAVEYLGLATVRSLVLSAHIFSCFNRTELKGMPVETLWKHAVGTSSLARLISQCEAAEPSEVEDACVAGMVHDVGKLMLADALRAPFDQALMLAEEQGIPLHEAELRVFGATHAGAAAYLLGLWGLPAPLVEAVAFHHAPAGSEHRAFGPLTAVHVADVLEYEIFQTPPVGRREEIDREYLKAIGCADRLEVWRTEGMKLAHSKNGH